MTMPYPPINYPMGMNMMMPRNYQGGAPPSTLYIGNLDETVHEEQLYAHFAKYGTLHSVKIVKDRMTGKSRGFGYVNFYNLKEAENARLLSQYEKIGRKPIRILHKGDPKTRPEANLFVKNIDPAVTDKDLHNHFSKCGPVVSVKIAYDKSGGSLGYGYVQFEKPEDSLKAISELDGTKLKEQEINVEKFKPRGSRDTANNNLYVKHLPEGKTKEEIEKILQDVFGKFGTVGSLLAVSKDGKSWSAFICYEEEEAAQAALDNLNGKVTLDGADQPLYVNLHASRDQRAQDQGTTSTQNNTNLFIKNLKPEVKEEQLLEVLKAYGEIATASLKQTEFSGKKYGMAFINFKYPQDAANAQHLAKDKEEVKKLFYDDAPYIGFLLSKDQRDQYKQTKANRKPMTQYMSQNMPQMQMYPPQFQQQGFYPPQNFGMQQGFRPQMQQPQQMQQQRSNWMGSQFPQQQQQQQGMQQQQFGQNFPQQQQQQFGQNYQQRSQQPFNKQRQGNFGNQNQRPQGGGQGRGQYQGGQDRGQYQGGQDRGQYQGGQGRGQYQGGQGRGQYQGGQDQGQNQKQRQYQAPTNQKLQNESNVPTQRNEKEVSTKASEHHMGLTVQNLKEKLDDFLKLDPERQRNILGEMLFPKVLGLSGPIYAPKITGMLVDFDVLSVQEILDLLEDTESLRERVSEAQELIDQEGN